MSEAKKYANLSRIDKVQYRAVNDEGTAWVKRTVRGNNEQEIAIAHALALTYDKVIGSIQSDLDKSGTTLEELKNKKPNFGTSEWKETMAKIRLVEDQKKMKGELEGSRIYPYEKDTQDRLIAATNREDFDAVLGLLTDIRFDKVQELLQHLDDQQLLALFAKTDQVNCRIKIIDNIANARLQHELIKQEYAKVRAWEEEKGLKVCLPEHNTAKKVFFKFIAEGDISSAKAMLDDGENFEFLEASLDRVIGQIDTPEFLMLMAQQKEDPLPILKYLASIPIFEHIVATNAAEFTASDETTKQHIVELARKMLKALQQPLEIYGNDQVHGRFILTLRQDTGAFCLVWNPGHDYHKYLMQDIAETLKTDFSLTMGGKICSDQDDPYETDKIAIRISDKSVDYGSYSRAILEHYRPQLEDYFRQQFRGKEIDLEIRVSL